MPTPSSRHKEIRQLARYQVRPEGLDRCLIAIQTLVAYVRDHEPGTLRYDVWQERDHPTRFVHAFIFQDEEAQRIHSKSPEVKAFSSVLYPECLDPVQFVDYHLVASKG